MRIFRASPRADAAGCSGKGRLLRFPEKVFFFMSCRRKAFGTLFRRPSRTIKKTPVSGNLSGNFHSSSERFSSGWLHLPDDLSFRCFTLQTCCPSDGKFLRNYPLRRMSIINIRGTTQIAKKTLRLSAGSSNPSAITQQLRGPLRARLCQPLRSGSRLGSDGPLETSLSGSQQPPYLSSGFISGRLRHSLW